MRRQLFTILSALSLLLCVATCVLWARSYRVGDHPVFHHSYWFARGDAPGLRGRRGRARLLRQELDDLPDHAKLLALLVLPGGRHGVDNETVRAVLAEALGRIFGGAALSPVSLRVDVKHAFKLSPRMAERQVNPVLLFPVDYAYGGPAELAEAVADGFAMWLASARTVPALLLAAMVKPPMYVGLQVSTKGDDSAVGRVLLRIDDVMIEKINY